jgi:hypothetical protein
MVEKFRKKPVVIEAVQFKTNNESDDKNMNEIVIWINQGKKINEKHAWHNGTYIVIETLEGDHIADVGDWIIKGVKGEFYPCKPDIFEQTYEKVEEK